MMSYDTLASFGHPEKTPSRIDFSSNFMFPKTHSWAQLFLCLFYANTVGFGIPFKIQRAPQWDPTSTKWRQKA